MYFRKYKLTRITTIHLQSPVNNIQRNQSIKPMYSDMFEELHLVVEALK